MQQSPDYAHGDVVPRPNVRWTYTEFDERVTPLGAGLRAQAMGDLGLAG